MKVIRHRSEGALPSGAYSPAVEIRSGKLRNLYVSGQGTKDPVTGTRVLGSIVLQSKAAMDNLKAVVEGAGFAMGDIVKVTLYLSHMTDFETVDGVYASYFPEGEYPARATIAVAGLPGGQGIEIDAFAVKEE